jgi:hypothetical protein
MRCGCKQGVGAPGGGGGWVWVQARSGGRLGLGRVETEFTNVFPGGLMRFPRGITRLCWSTGFDGFDVSNGFDGQAFSRAEQLRTRIPLKMQLEYIFRMRYSISSEWCVRAKHEQPLFPLCQPPASRSYSTHSCPTLGADSKKITSGWRRGANEAPCA